MLNDLSSSGAETAIADAWSGALATDTGYTLKCGCSSCMKSFYGETALLPPDGVGDVKFPIPPFTGILNTVDAASNGIGGNNPTLTIDGPEIVATIDTIGDKDFYAITLTAGQTIKVGMYQTMGTPPGQLGVPLADAFVEFYNAAGEKLGEIDGGGPNTPSGLDALGTFTAGAAGTYYINAQSFDQDPTNGTDGDGVGDYRLFVQSSEPVFRYDIDSPLHSIDWGGATIANTSRNPDGAEGPRPTGFAQEAGGLTGGGADGSAHDSTGDVQAIAGKNVITYYFGRQGDAFTSSNPTSPGLENAVQVRDMTEYEKEAFRLSFADYERVADLVFVEVDNRADAYFKIVLTNLTPGPGASVLGRASPPGEQNEGQMEFNALDERFTEPALAQGGFFFQTLLHEYGHAMGLAHPHDTGGGSSVMRGGGGGTGGIGGGFGDFDLSQQVFTIMSYNDGWSKSPYGGPDDSSDHGWAGTLGALDIAVIQDKYGVNEEYNAGNNVYTLNDVNARGTYYQTIWDAGGKDTIRYDGLRDAVIDLREATLEYEEGGGGRVSYANGIFGGFTIANGVTIENAIGGAGADALTGNDGNNLLNGGIGADTLVGGGGRDNLLGGDGADVLHGGSGLDVITGGLGADKMTGGRGADTFVFTRALDSTVTQRDAIYDFRTGIDKIDVQALNIVDFDDQVMIVVGSKGNSNVLIDTDGDGAFDDFSLFLEGVTVQEGDFLL